MTKFLPIVFNLLLSTFFVSAQTDAGLFRFPDVSATQVVFTYANDIWVMPKTGGTAQKLSSPAGVEIFAKFSPDGKNIAYTAFPDYFRKKGLGPLIGSRTWGGLIGISGVPDLIDGGTITVPTFRMYNIDGTWFKEGHGVDPDIHVPEDLGMMAKGIDPQLERAITEIKMLLKTKGFQQPTIPGYEIR